MNQFNFYIQNKHPLLGTVPFDKFFHQSNGENMKQISPEIAQRQKLGFALVRSVTIDSFSRILPLAYAAIPEVVEWEGQSLAIIGSILVSPLERRKGYGTSVVRKLLEAARTEPEHMGVPFDGFMARCNEKSAPLLEYEGFKQVAESAGKLIMVSTDVPWNSWDGGIE